GRLPINTEIRKYSDHLIREVILKEIERDGQVYFLHNRVETIESMANKLRILVPEATFIVAHGQMKPKELEERVVAFKNGEYQVLISSTIIENGIDLPSANTMIINNAEKFGLSQLYQLRGRIGRSDKQAFAYLLYNTQKLNLDAKKRLRALLDASELGSGFQIAMHDLEIRGAGEILGSSQHGMMKTVGVTHFLRLLQKTIQEIQSGQELGEGEDIANRNVTIELPIDAFIPNEYIPNSKEKIAVYQKLASVDNLELLNEFKEDLHDEYGQIPSEVENLFKVLRLKMAAKRVHIIKIMAPYLTAKEREIELVMGEKCTPAFIVKLLDQNPKWLISGHSLKIAQKELDPNWLETLIAQIGKMSA
ncbi:MAG TPA: helicase-related protein, partial [Candidatus Gracilibacteria bacterium]|nr:helicase-related protein [Candidatus Gracilibacteria bacterium]